MRELKRGVEFELSNFDGTGKQVIKFTEKDGKGGYNEGTTNEEVVNMLVERFYYLGGQGGSRENILILELLKVIRRALAKRLDRKIKKLHGTPK